MSCFQLLPGRLDPKAQSDLVAEVERVIEAAPLFTPVTPGGQPFSVRMTNCGPLGWMSDRAGYRYQDHHPETGKPWPAIPKVLLDLWSELVDPAVPPEACLINLYDATAKMGLHQDRDEDDLDAPVLSLSLGDTAVFRVGGTSRGGRTMSLKLQSGDALSFGGPARLAFHGIDRIIAGTSTLLPQGGRINLTLRRVTRPPA
jgi:alkylated DNA repair protein (DNA oxidative demethylase)